MKCSHLLSSCFRLGARLSIPALCTALVLLVTAPCAAQCALADSCGPAEWQRVSTPSHENLLVLPGSDIDSFAVAGPDRNTIYAIGTWNSPCANVTPIDPFSPPATLFSTGQAPRLWMTSDGGVTWEDRTAHVLDACNLPDAGAGEYDDFLAFTAVAAAPDDPDIVLVAGYDRDGTAVVVASNDGAQSFSYLGCDAIDGMVLCAAISPGVEGIRQCAVGTSDAVNGGRIWRYKVGAGLSEHWTDASVWPGWADHPSWAGDPSNVYAITSIAFSPDYRSDASLLAIAVARAVEADGDVYTGFYLVEGVCDAAASWNASAGFEDYPVLIRQAGGVIHAPTTPPAFLLRGLTDLALPADFNADADVSRVSLVAVNGMLVNPSTESVLTEGGFLCWILDDTLSQDLVRDEGNPWIASVAYSGTADGTGELLVGTSYPQGFTWADVESWFVTGSPDFCCCSGVDILYSAGNDACCPRWEWSADPPSGQFNAQIAWLTGGIACASTSGDGRLWIGGNWYADESAFSRSASPIDHWEQTGMVDTMIHHLAAMAYDPAEDALHLHTRFDPEAGAVCCCESIWRSGEDGATWHRELLGNPEANDADDDAFDAIINGYYRGFYQPVTEGYVQSGSIGYLIGDAIDEDDERLVQQDFQAGTIYRRIEDGGEWLRISDLVLNYERLLDINCSSDAGRVLYAGFDNLWWDYTTNEPLPYQPDGTDPVRPFGHDCRKVSGALRLLDPQLAGCCGGAEWDYLIRGLSGTSDTNGIYEQLHLAGSSCSECGVRVWAIDDGNRYWSADGDDSETYDWCAARFSNDRWGRLWVYDDCYVTGTITTTADDPERTIPSDSCRCAHEAFSLDWQRTCDACEYQLQIAFDRRFTQLVLETDTYPPEAVPTGTHFYRPPQPDAPSLLVDEGTLDCNQEYWWRVRARLAETGEIITSRWSAPERIFTAPGPPGQIQLRSPADGASSVAVKDIGFTWTTVTGATRYDFLLVDANRAHVASQVGDFTAFMLPLTLDYDTAYVWRVIALDGDRVITESNRATFRTEAEPRPPATSVTGPTIVTAPASASQNWLWYFSGAVGFLLALALGALSHVNRRIRHERETNRDFRRNAPRR